MFYKVIMECGHIGAGNNFEKAWFIRGKNPLEAVMTATRLPGVKKKDSIGSVKLVQKITRSEYIKGIIAKRRLLS